MEQLQLFHHPQLGNLRGSKDEDEEPWFVGIDVALALGYSNPSKAIKDHVEQEDKLNNESLSSIGQRGGWLINESGLYCLIFQAKTKEAKTFKRWVTNEVLPAIRKTGKYELPVVKSQEPKKKVASVNAVRSYYEVIRQKKELLGLSDSSVANLTNKADEALGIENLQIDYVPSKGVLSSATVLLKENGFGISAQEFNKKCLAKGILTQHSRKAKNGKEKRFYAISDEWLTYGENEVNPKNDHEVQPLWYRNTFVKLYNTL